MLLTRIADIFYMRIGAKISRRMSIMSQNHATPLLQLRNLNVRIGDRSIVRDLSLDINRGQCFALVGESGSGKSMTAMAIARLVPPGIIVEGDILWCADGQATENLLDLDDSAMRKRNGKDIAMIFQEPLSALNPLHRIERQISEAITIKQPTITSKALSARIKELLSMVKLEDSRRIRQAFPHELSGGQLQRIVIAIALANRPHLLIADEPTTALDASTRRGIISLLHELQTSQQLTLLFISHDWGTVRDIADSITLLDQGKLISTGSLKEATGEGSEIMERYKPLQRRQDVVSAQEDSSDSVLLEAQGLQIQFPIYKGLFKRVAGYIDAVHPLDFRVKAGDTLGIVGESGAGKSSLALALLRFVPATGQVRFDGTDLLSLKGGELQAMRRRIQWVPQDPFSSLSPRQLVGDIVSEGLGVFESHLTHDALWLRAQDALKQCGLPVNTVYRYAHELSGGQRQRVAIARVILLRPKLIILDEPTSALDLVTTRAILDLLLDMQRRLNLAYIVISHDIQVIGYLASEILVLRHGQAIEQGSAGQILTEPKNNYTQELLLASR